MEPGVRPVIIFHGRNEFEAQMARDILQSAMIPILHIPSLSTGVFGVQHATRVAVAEDHVPQAMEALRDAGFSPAVEEPTRGWDEFRETVREGLPVDRAPAPPNESRLTRTMLIVLALIVVLGVYFVIRRRG